MSERGAGRTVLSASTGTLVARVLGFLRNIALAAALGTGLVSDSYNLANQVPNQIFLLLGGGVIAAVFLPQLATLRVRSEQDADRYGTILLICSGAFGIVVSALLLAFSGPLIAVLGGGSWGVSQRELTFAFFLWCIPQVAAASVFTVASQLMNARGKFTSVSWLPALSSVGIIVGALVVVASGEVSGDSPDSVPLVAIIILGAATLGGTVLQTVVLCVLLLRVGFRPQWRGGVRGLGLRVAVRTGLLAVASAICYQVSNLLTAAWASQAGATAADAGLIGFGFSALFYAQAIVSVVQGVAVSSLASVLLQRLSKHFAASDDTAAFHELDDALLRLASFVLPVAGLLVALGPGLSEVMFARGETSSDSARVIGVVLAILAAGLLPYTWHALLIRPFYAKHDAMRPLYSAIIINTIWIATGLMALLWLPAQSVILGLAVGFAASYWLDLPIKLRWLSSRIGYRMNRAARGDILRAAVATASVSLVVGAPGWAVLFLIDPPLISVLAIVAAQTLVFIAAYVLLTRRSSISPVELVRWLKK
ncbi:MULTISPECIES: murein biosynthesis integral membrane protein MurJ [unclassified Rathayibacter]|uniref:murein biosynthesis integral membrane protein MurJ n=1 Tax=unclassified Rathayibacter TaxID=2609250 RepID=UPI0006F2DFDF|nr:MULTISPECIES: lipid II flippase MurJ [unclassified Rathayibacter]KQP97448.1 hypothetical protein ASF42_17285 [Rathayibacter sp. Leaf294]KQS07120.1 hypothetical protein ASG06_18020 [Rathayibacter sp. Leaf185]